MKLTQTINEGCLKFFYSKKFTIYWFQLLKVFFGMMVRAYQLIQKSTIGSWLVVNILVLQVLFMEKPFHSKLKLSCANEIHLYWIDQRSRDWGSRKKCYENFYSSYHKFGNIFIFSYRLLKLLQIIFIDYWCFILFSKRGSYFTLWTLRH